MGGMDIFDGLHDLLI